MGCVTSASSLEAQATEDTAMTVEAASGASHRPAELLETLAALGFRVAVTVPDGWLGELLARIERHPSFTLVRATHEEEALAIACGARLGGARAALLIQNVGLLSMGAGMACLAQRYQMPLLILASYRGSMTNPVYYHIPKGRVTEPVLRGLGVPYACSDGARPIGAQVEEVATYAEEGSMPAVLLLGREDVRW